MSTTRTPSSATHRALWVAQFLLAAVFLFAGSMKFVMSAAQMQAGGISLPIPFIHFIGICECLGALGLVLPGLTHMQTWLTPVAAAGLTVIMVGATVVTIKTMGVVPALFPFVVGVIALWIAYARFRLGPLADTQRRTFSPTHS